MVYVNSLSFRSRLLLNTVSESNITIVKEIQLTTTREDQVKSVKKTRTHKQIVSTVNIYEETLSHKRRITTYNHTHNNVISYNNSIIMYPTTSPIYKKWGFGIPSDL